jgi:hypothetical protein
MMTFQQAYDYTQQILTLITLMAIQQCEQTVDPVRRVAIKLNPALRGQFLVMVVLQNGQHYEGRSMSDKRSVDWCLMPNCNCQGFA